MLEFLVDIFEVIADCFLCGVFNRDKRR